MRRVAFVFALAGIFVLSIFLNFGTWEISGVSELYELELNSRVSFVSEVVSERKISGGRKLLNLENGITAVCSCEGNFSGTSFRFVGIVSDFEGERQIEILRAESVA